MGERPEKPPRGVTVRKYASGKSVIQVHFKFRGAQYREVLHGMDPAKKNHLKAAGNLKAEIDSAINRGRFVYQEFFPNSKSKKAALLTNKGSDITIGEVFDDLVKVKIRNRGSVKEKSFYEKCVNILKPRFKDLRIADLKPSHIKTWIYDQETTEKTIRSRLTPLRDAVKFALDEQIIEKDPFVNIVIERLVADEQKNTGSKADPFSQKEIGAIIDTADEIYGPSIRNLLEFAFFSGLRTSELFGLQWDMVDFEAGVVKVHRVIVDRVEKETTKTEAGKRDVIMTARARKALLDQQAYTRLAGKYVFVRPGGLGHFFDYEHLSRRWKRILRTCNVRYRVQYQTRHTYASQMLSGGENPFFVAQQMGHVDVEMVNKRYGKWISNGEKTGQHQFTAEFAK
ncbi:site-specific integrase [Sedimenticola hydrogenitrophicus]|uniref:site-specific integrase n=1 Tax=Sedimenticola hydrogenitrophicus TaxID=2967975 RepID=UPI0023AEFA60|nr:site-specific integrase [Sedimenticola hydrogenitrophicus]